MADSLDEKERKLQERLAKINALEQEIKQMEKRVKQRENAKKQLVLRLSPHLWDEIAQWAEDDFRSINGQIEYLLSECVKQRRRKSSP